VLTAPLTGRADFDVTKFNWIGNVTRDKYVGYVWHTAPVQSLSEAKIKQLVVGGTSVGGLGIDGAIVLKDIFGYKLKIVSGYKTSNEVKIALERGEVEGTLGNALSSLNQTDWLAKSSCASSCSTAAASIASLPTCRCCAILARDDAEQQMIDIPERARRNHPALSRAARHSAGAARHPRGALSMRRCAIPLSLPTCSASGSESKALRPARRSRPWPRSSRAHRLPWSSGSSPC
jgi:hypothetical protein